MPTRSRQLLALGWRMGKERGRAPQACAGCQLEVDFVCRRAEGSGGLKAAHPSQR